MRIFGMMSTIVGGHVRHYGLPFLQDAPTQYGTVQSAISKYAYDVFTNPYGLSLANIGYATTKHQGENPGVSRLPQNNISVFHKPQIDNPKSFNDFLLYFEYLR